MRLTNSAISIMRASTYVGFGHAEHLCPEAYASAASRAEIEDIWRMALCEGTRNLILRDEPEVAD
jgi:hypothetical protein